MKEFEQIYNLTFSNNSNYEEIIWKNFEDKKRYQNNIKKLNNKFEIYFQDKLIGIKLNLEEAIKLYNNKCDAWF